VGDVNDRKVTAMDLVAEVGGSTGGATAAGVRVFAAIDAWRLKQDSVLERGTGRDRFKLLANAVWHPSMDNVFRTRVSLASPVPTSSGAKGE